MSVKHNAYSYWIHTFTNISMITLSHLQILLWYLVHIKTINTLPSWLKYPVHSLLPHAHHTNPYYTTHPPPTNYTPHSYYCATYVYTPPHQKSSQFTTFTRQKYLHWTMSEWGKPKRTAIPMEEWGEPGWGQHDTEMHTKVPCYPPLLKLKTRLPSLEDFTCPTKKSRSSKLCTHFDNLFSDILHNTNTWSFSPVHHEKFQKDLTRIT